MKANFGVDAELIESRGGVFEVIADGATIFSKKNLGRFPDENEVTDILTAVQSSKFKVERTAAIF